VCRIVGKHDPTEASGTKRGDSADSRLARDGERGCGDLSEVTSPAGPQNEILKFDMQERFTT